MLGCSLSVCRRGVRPSGPRGRAIAYPTISMQHSDAVVEHLRSFNLVDSNVLWWCRIDIQILGQLVVIIEGLMEAMFEL